MRTSSVGAEKSSGDGVERSMLLVFGQDVLFFDVNGEEGVLFLFYEIFISTFFYNY